MNSIHELKAQLDAAHDALRDERSVTRALTQARDENARLHLELRTEKYALAAEVKKLTESLALAKCALLLVDDLIADGQPRRAVDLVRRVSLDLPTVPSSVAQPLLEKLKEEL